MALIDWLGFYVSIFGMYGLVLNIRNLLPRYIISDVSSNLNKAEQSIAHAVTTGAIPEMSEFRVDIEILASRFARMRIESHRSPGLFPQIWLAVRHGLTCRLLSLASQIGHVGLKVEILMDERRLLLLAAPQVVVVTLLPTPAGDVVIPLAHIAEPAVPPPPTTPVD